MTYTPENKQYFVFKSKRVSPGGVFKSMTPWVPGRVIDVAHYNDVQFIEYEPYTNHKDSLATLRGI